MRLKYPYLYILINLAVAVFATVLYADTIYYRDGAEEKGIVVESFHDRVVLNTIDGEKVIKKEDIRDILYDRMEQNFVKLGDFHQSKGNLARAYAYYKKAYELNPDYKEAEDRYIHMRLVLMGRADKQLKDDLAAKNLMLKASGRVYEPKTTEDETIPETQIEKFKNETGLVLASKDGMPTVELVVAKSAADKAGIKTNDIIFTVWGKLTGYLELNTILDMIMESPSHEIMLDIKRKINMPLKKTNGTGFDSLGLGLDIKEGGLTATAIEKDSIAAKSGLAEGDTITAINGDTTRYASLKDAIQLFNESKASDIELDIIRRVMLWRKDI